MDDLIKSRYIANIESILRSYDEIDLATQDHIPVGKFYALIARTKSLIANPDLARTHHAKDIWSIIQENSSYSFQAEAILGILKALKQDIEEGFLQSFSTLIRGETFQDYLIMAKHLLEEGYKDPAAVVAGSTMEAHLRQLCKKYDVSLEIIKENGKTLAKTAGVINQDLARAQAYSSYEQKRITAWQDMRNNAAHGKYGEYEYKDVEDFIAWLESFIVKYPA
jgi:hypothetical protein